MKKILLCICIFSFCYSSYSDRLKNNGYNNSEYSIGLNDKTSFYGLISKSWIKDKDYGESYVTLGGLGLAGSLGYGRKYYLRRGRFFSPYVSATGFGYYLLAIAAVGGVGISGNLGIDITTVEYKDMALKFQFGLFSAFDPFSGQSLIIPGDGGPSYIMPSFSMKLYFKK